jgi:hypothetical protein
MRRVPHKQGNLPKVLFALARKINLVLDRLIDMGVTFSFVEDGV